MNFLMYRFLQLVSVLQWANWIRLSWFEPRSDLIYVMASFIQVLCLSIFWYHVHLVKSHRLTIVFSLDPPTQFINQKFYKIIRHPYYTCYLLCYYSMGLLWLDIGALVLATLTFGIYYKAAQLEELKFLNSPMKNKYEEYQKKTGMFFPKLKIKL